MTTDQICTAFVEVCEYSYAMGARDINKKPGCYESQVDDHWWFAINPHGETYKCSRGASVPGLHVYVEFNEFPAGIISAYGGVLAAGEAANEQTFIAALRAAAAPLTWPGAREESP